MEFDELDLPGPVSEGIRAAGFRTATPIQEATLPVALKGKDVAGQAQTGTGKTAAFLIATFTRLLTNPPPAGGRLAPRALIIAPTRELVVQIDADARLLGQFTGLRTHVVYGGVDYVKQRETLRGPVDVLAGTPGRLIDYLKQRVWSPAHVEVLVLDEADRMFDMGFIRDIRWILRRLPPHDQRQSFLFSATLSFRVLELTWEFMNNPVQITVSPEQVTVPEVEQVLYHAGRHEKFSLLLGLLRAEQGARVLMFANTREETRRLAERLSANGHPAAVLSGDLDQRQRLRTLEAFKDGRLPILVATDVASRGLHIPEVSHVYNWDLPQDPEDYVHRIGRTARAGARGKAISLVDEASALSLEPVERFLGHQIRVEWAENDLFLPEIRVARSARSGPGAGRGGGPAGSRRGATRDRGRGTGAGRLPSADHARPPASRVEASRSPAEPPRSVPTPRPITPSPAGRDPSEPSEPGRPRRRRRGGRGRGTRPSSAAPPPAGD